MKYTYCSPCLLGIEGLVAEELRELECENVRAENGRVLFEGGPEIGVRANIGSRFSERVMLFIGTFEAKSFEMLFEGTKALPWEQYLPRDCEFPVTGSSLSSGLHSVPDCQSIVKKAVVERLKGKYGISWFPETGNRYRIRFTILKDAVSLMIDLSGEGLHKRGYRRQSTTAPIKETLAAAMVKLARVRRDGTFYDPFCGSGTLLIEAAMLARNISPGIRRRFVAEDFPLFEKAVWEKERERARALEHRGAAFTATGYDIDPAAVELTAENAAKAGVASCVRAKKRDIADFTEDSAYGCVVCNPPYGERLMDVKQAKGIYRVMGERFPRRQGWSYAVITPDEDFERLFGRRADKKRKLYNGMIKCQLYLYFNRRAAGGGVPRFESGGLQ